MARVKGKGQGTRGTVEVNGEARGKLKDKGDDARGVRE